MKARIQLTKSLQPDATIFKTPESIMRVNNVFNDCSRENVIYCEMLAVVRTSDLKYGDYCLIHEGDRYIVEKCDKIVKPETIGVRDVFIGQAGTLTAMDNVEKIIASTYKFEDGMTKIHKSFINKFVELENEDNKITDIWIVENTNGEPLIVSSSNTIIIEKYIDCEEIYDEQELSEEDKPMEESNDWVDKMLKEVWPNEIEGNEQNIRFKILDTNMNKINTSVIFKLTVPNELNEYMLEQLAILQELGMME